MDEYVKIPKVKLYIKENTYYLYEVYSNSSNQYLYIPSENAEKQTNIPVDDIGNMIIEFLNTDYDFMINIVDEYYSNGAEEKIEILFDKLFVALQNNFNYIFAVLIMNKYFELLDKVFNPNFSDMLSNTFVEKYDKLCKYIKDKENCIEFNLEYLKEFDLDYNENISINSKSNIFRTIIHYIADEHKLDKLLFQALMTNDNLDILTLIPSNSIKNIQYEILPNTDDVGKNKLIEVYAIDDLTTFLYYEILQIQKNNMLIRKCETCNKYFIPKDPRQIYCSNYCNTKSYESKLKENPVMKLYRNTYKSQNRKKNKYIEVYKYVEVNWEKYKIELNKQKDRCLNNEISIDDFKLWIGRNSNWFLKNEYNPF